MNWQPIETAPKDGRQIIAYQPGGAYSNGFVFPATVGLAYWWKGDNLNPPSWVGPANPRDYPTHWMPLPAPPLPVAREAQSSDSVSTANDGEHLITLSND